MCEKGQTVKMKLIGRMGEDAREVDIDKCIASIIKALNEGGVLTKSSCCGHGGDGYILLHDGRGFLLKPLGEFPMSVIEKFQGAGEKSRYAKMMEKERNGKR